MDAPTFKVQRDKLSHEDAWQVIENQIRQHEWYGQCPIHVLDAHLHLFKRVCPSVYLTVHRSIYESVSLVRLFNENIFFCIF